MSSLSTYAKEMLRLMGALTVSKSFRASLWKDPKQALDVGYGGSPFYLSSEQQELIYSIHADSVQEFASKLLQEGQHYKYET